MDLHGNLIDGAWITDGEAAANINPSDTDDIVGHYLRGDAGQAHAAIAAARAALPEWAASPILTRHAILRRASDELTARKDELGTLLAREEGKTLAEGVGEVIRAAQVFDFFAGECLRPQGEALPSTRPGIEVQITREAVGVVGLITPWNFPIAIPAWKLAPALAWGNTVILKPADATPGCAWALADILHRAGLPAGVLNLVMGRGSVVGQVLLDSPEVDAISFTGSVGTGARVAAASAARMRRCQLEMGGKNPMVVLDDADLDTAVEASVNGAFYSTGQRCTASSRLIVTEGIHDRFLDALAARTRALRVGHALDPQTQVGPVVDAAQFAQNQDYIGIGQAEGAQLICGGEALNRPTPGHFMAPALFAETTNDMRIAREEIFGPVACVIRVRDYEHALAVANDTDFGLSAGICTTSLKHAAHFRRNAQAGMVMVNLPTAGVDFHVPFGGRKGSSLGPREQGRYAAEFYSVVKTAYSLA